MPDDNTYNPAMSGMGGFNQTETPKAEETTPTNNLNPYTSEAQPTQKQEDQPVSTPMSSVYGENSTPQTEEAPSTTATVSPMTDFSTQQENIAQLPSTNETETTPNPEVQELKERVATLEKDMRNFMSAAGTMTQIVEKYSKEENTTETQPPTIEEVSDETYNNQVHQEVPDPTNDPNSMRDLANKLRGEENQPQSIPVTPPETPINI